MDKYLEWIKSDNNNYITLGDFGLNPTVEINFAPISINGDGWECFLESNEGMTIYWPGASSAGVTPVTYLGFSWDGNNGGTATGRNIVSGNWYNATFSPTGITLDGTIICLYDNEKSITNVRIGPTLDFRHSTGMYGEITVKDENGVIIKHYLPIERNGVAGMYEEIGQTFHSPAGNAWISGPVTHIFIPSKIKSNFESTGGTDTFTINAETTWTASTPTNFTVSPLTGDTGETTVTITAADYTGTTRLEETITFTDADDYTFDYQIRQKAQSTGGSSDLYMGDINITQFYFGEDPVISIYLGDTQVYSQGPYVGLKVTPDSFSLISKAGTYNLNIKSSENWSISGVPAWIAFDTTSGTPGKYTVPFTVYAYEGDPGDERTATISVTAGAYSASTVITQKALSLPDVPFMFNYNCTNYNGGFIIQKEDGQLFNENIVLNGAVPVLSDGAMDFRGSTSWMGKEYASAADNPFNRNASNKAFTFIYKTSGFNGNMTNIFANRTDSSSYNYMVRGSIFHTSSASFLTMDPSQSPQTVVIRINPDGTSERWCVETGQKVTASSVSYGSSSKGFGFFSGFGDIAFENFNAVFYWMYCSLNALTDEEIQEVITYNNSI